MKKIILLIGIMLFFSLSFSQETSKSEKLFRLSTGEKVNITTYYKDGMFRSKKVDFLGLNRKHLLDSTELIVMFSGDKEVFKKYIEDLTLFLNNNEEGKCTTISETCVNIRNSMGRKILIIGNKNGFIWIGSNELRKLSKKYDKVYNNI